MDKHDTEMPDESRRSFLKAARGAGALGVLAAAAAGGAAEAAPAPEPAAAAPQAKGYRVTEHIQKYYSTARYW
ncbi:formate dehydrogenase [Massilia sp. GCM10020059]|uniref:Formate dehydrogenase n=1 Tax=Massilia agrisoli TaxID=2892444 RepID=A0ABS8IM60_9BURK|nr:formate dehydrogenase [Massilia agrisoli]MCC6069539.1 formate dehydrogenase [Massilia agrisoli]